jgi:hypothetical protein
VVAQRAHQTIANFQLCIQGRAEINLTVCRRVLAGSAGDDDNLCSAALITRHGVANAIEFGMETQTLIPCIGQLQESISTPLA